MDPWNSNLTHTANILFHLFSTLADIDHTYSVVPSVAESWENKDDLTWEVHLRDGMTFSDGEPITADDVVASLDHGAESSTARFIESFASWSAQDESTVVITTKKPDPAFANTLTRVHVMSAKQLSELSQDELCQKPVGSGPYHFVSWDQGGDIVLEKNEGHFLTPIIDKIIFKAVPEKSTGINMLINGEANLVQNVPPDDFGRIESSGSAKIESAPGIRRIINIVDTRSAPFDNLKVRQALAHAVDMDAIVESILGGYATVALGTRPAISAYANPDKEPFAFDPDKARALLAEAGYPDGFEMDYNYPTGRWLKDSEVAGAIASYLSDVGIKVNLKTTEYGTFFSDWSDGKYSGMTMIGTIDSDGAEGAASSEKLFLRSGGLWSFSWSEPEYDALIDKAEFEMDPVERTKTFQEMDKYINDAAVWCCGYDQNEIYGISSNLVYQVHPVERIILWDAYFEPAK